MKSKFKKIMLGHGNSIGFFCVYLALVAYPIFISTLNPIPKEDDVKYFRGKILHADTKHPQIVFKIDDGTICKGDIATGLTTPGFNVLRFYGLNSEQLLSITGKDAVIGAEILRGLPQNRWRVWSIKSAAVSYDYNQAKQYYEKNGVFGWNDAALQIFYLLFLILIIWIERRKRNGTS